MKSNLCRFVSWLVLCLCFIVSVNAADSKDIEEIKRIGRAFDQALIARNVAGIDATLADDCVGIWADASTSTRAEMLETVKSGAYKLFSVDYKEEQVRIYGNTAVSRVLSSVDEEDKGKRQKTTGWSTGVWIKKDGKWKLVSIHISNKPKAE